MTKSKKTTLRITQNGIELLGLMLIELKNEILVKPTGRGIDVHWSYVHSDGKLRTHVTHERYKGKRRHRQIRSVPPEKMVRVIVTMFSQPGDPSPKLGPLDDEGERKKLDAWLKRVLPKVFHQPTDEPVQVLRDGPVKEFLNACLSVGSGKDIEIGPLCSGRRNRWGM